MNNFVVTRAHFRQLRYILYFAFPILYFACLNGLSMLTSVEAAAGEEGYGEDLQTVTLIAASLLLFRWAYLFSAQRAFLVFAGLLGSLATIREQNNTAWYHVLYHIKGTSWLYGITIVGTWIYFQRKVFFKQLWQVVAWPSFILLFFGGLVVIGWSQVLTQRSLYVNILDDTVTEEGLESAGYFLILFGVCELYHELRRAAASPSPDTFAQTE
jgi:hypothetical protein